MKKTNKCRTCGSKKLKKVISLGRLHLSAYVKKGSKIKSKKYPLNLLFCADCSLLQLDESVNRNILYTDNYGYYSGINNTMAQELKDIVQAVQRSVSLKKDDFVVDIGSNDATLLKFYPKKINKAGFDLVAKFRKHYSDPGFYFFNEAFNADSFIKKFKNKKSRVITAISMFYDLDNPNIFLNDIKKILTDDGVLIIQQNYLPEMIRLCAFDNIVHEHLTYFSLISLENLLKKHGMEVYDVEKRPLNGGSFRTFIQFSGGPNKIKSSVAKMRQSEKKYKLGNLNTYLRLSENINTNSERIRKFVSSEFKKGKKIFVYGASTRGNTLLQYTKLDSNLISFAVERNPDKWGTKIGSTNIPIISETEGRNLKPDYMLVLPWYFKEEIVRREKSYLGKGGHLIFPLPNLEIV